MPLTQVSSRLIEDTLRYVLGASGTNHYTFTGKGLTGAVNDPTLTLSRGHTYIFENRSGGHPFYIKTSIANGGTNDAYNTGVTNNGGGNGTEIVFTVPHDAPDTLYYQCSSHSSMAGQLNIAGSVADGSITTAKLADQAVDLSKLPHGTSSNDGKFLRANNGADPSFESLPASGVSVSNNADNRVVTGDGTNLNAEAKLTFDGDFLSAKNANGNAGVDLNVSNNTNPRIDFNTANVASSGIIKSEESGSGAIMEFHNKNSSGSEQQVITLTIDRNLQINDGNLVVASGHGIDFSATSNSSNGTMASELLDDYESGTWSPIIKYSGGRLTPHSDNIGTYTKIGNNVTVNGTIRWSGIADSSDTSWFVRVQGLPFTGKDYGSSGYNRTGQVLGATNGSAITPSNSNYTNLSIFYDAPQTYFYIVQHNVASGGYDHTPTVHGNGTIYGFQLTYQSN